MRCGTANNCAELRISLEQRTTVSMTAVADSAPKPAKPARIPKKIQQAIHLLVTGTVATQRAAAERVSITETHLSRMLKRPNIRAFLASETRRQIDGAQAPAAGVLMKLLDSDSDHVAKDVAIHLLRINGIGPVDASKIDVTHTFVGAVITDNQQLGAIASIMGRIPPGPGYLIDLRKSPADAAPPDAQSDARSEPSSQEGAQS